MQQRQQQGAAPRTPSAGPALSPPQDALAAPSPGAESGSTAVVEMAPPAEPQTASQVLPQPRGLFPHTQFMSHIASRAKRCTSLPYGNWQRRKPYRHPGNTAACKIRF